MTAERFATSVELEAGLDAIRNSPRVSGVVELIVRRPAPSQREVLREAELDLAQGLVGDDWLTRGCQATADGSADPDAQLTVMNSRAIALLARHQDRWMLAGDQLYVDLDLSVDNLSAGTRLRVGTAVIEVTAQPHTGCKQFAARFGPEATRFVNSPEGKRLRLRGINTRIVEPGRVRVGDAIARL